MGNEIDLWNKILGMSLKMPGVQVNRDEYLARVLSNYCPQQDVQKAIATCPQMVLDKKVLSIIAASAIGSHRKQVSALSFASGLPGGVALAVTIPGDMAQYYWHALRLSQKLAYLYGIPALHDENGKLTDEAVDLLTVFIGVMGGLGAANGAMKGIAQAFAEQVAKRLPNYALTKYAIYNIAKQVAKWLGVSLTKGTFAKAVSKAVPVLGGITSGTITYIMFKKEAKRLQKSLQENMDLYKEAYTKVGGQTGGEYSEFEEVRN